MKLEPIAVIDGKIDLKDVLKLGAVMLEEGRRHKDPVTYIAREQIVARAIKNGFETIPENRPKKKASDKHNANSGI